MAATVRLLLCLLLLVLLAPATASATHWQGWDEEPDEEWVEPEPEPAPEPEPEFELQPEPEPQPDPELLPDLDPMLPDWPEDDDDGWEPEPEPEIPLVTKPTVSGRVAMLRTNGKAAIPRGAPKRVRAIIAAANRIAGKPYKWGGGHAKLIDRGYDCSGTVSYALIMSRTGLLSSPMVSGAFKKWGARGAGKWVTVYANAGHVYMEVAGLRLDTSTAGWGKKGVRWRPVTGRRKGFTARHPAGL